MTMTWPWLVLAALACLVAAVAAARARRCAVYEYMDRAGSPLYVGMSCDPTARARRHRRTWWWRHVDAGRTRIRWYPTRARAAAVEQATIRRRRPAANVVHNRRRARALS